ncbi:hypothetical protein V6N13_107111 [Hibiscus sabdariffa]
MDILILFLVFALLILLLGFLLGILILFLVFALSRVDIGSCQICRVSIGGSCSWELLSIPLRFSPPEVREGAPIVQPPSSVFEEGILDWKFALVGQFIGGAPNFASLCRIIDIYWILENGPWQIQNKPLVLRKWELNLKKLDIDPCKLPVWVQLYNVPLELYSKTGLSYIASALGLALYMYSITAYKESCSICNTFGHSIKTCYEKSKPTEVWKLKENVYVAEVGEPSVVGAVKECVVGEGSAGHNDVIVDEQLDLPCDQFVQDGSHLREVYVDPGGLASTDVQGVSIVLAPELIVGSDVI